MIDNKELLQGAETLGILLEPGQLEQFRIYADLLMEWNKHLNLTSVTSDDIIPLHYLDSLTACLAHNFSKHQNLLDLGTGAGFPGFPLKIAFPDLELTLVDSREKRLFFLEAVIRELSLTNVTVHHARAESLVKDKNFLESFDCITARAVAKLSTLAKWILPLLKEGGCALALKGKDIEGEVEGAESIIQSHHGELHRIVPVQIPGTEVERKIVVLKKDLF